MREPFREWPLGGLIKLNAEGTGDYKTIQEAIDSIEENNQIPIEIHLAPGIYEQEVIINGSKPNITFVGEDPLTTVISYDKHAGMVLPNGDVASTFRTATFTIYANHFKAKNISFVNHYDRSKSGGSQAVALYAYGEHHIYQNCRFIGLQDTLYTREGSHYFNDCYIEGDVDFIFGGSRAVFENCEIFGRNPEPDNPDKMGYVCAPSTVSCQKYGFLFLNCNIDGDFEKDRLYLGRPWHPASDPFYKSAALFKNCTLSDVVKTEGWKQMGGYQPRNNRLYEYNNSGAGAVAHEERICLSDEEADQYTVMNVLGWHNLGWMQEI